MPDFEDRCYDHQGFRIPVCWSAVIYGDDECICEGSPNAIAMDHRWRAWLRLQEMRDRKRELSARAEGMRSLPGAQPFTRIGPLVRVPLRLVSDR